MKLAAFALCAVAFVGCGAGAARRHAGVATVLTVVHSGVADLVVDAVDAQAAECEQRPDAERAQCADALADVAAPAASAVDVIRASIVAYREAVQVAAVAEEGQDVTDSLLRALARIVLEWDTSLVPALRRLGVGVPELPAIVRSLAEAALQ